MNRFLPVSMCVVLSFAAAAHAQQVWSGYDFDFAKADFADYTLAENQDRITDNVWITRADSQGIFNIAAEAGYETNVSPIGTEWAFGTTAEWSELDFQPWQLAIGNFPPGMIGEAMVLHLIDDDIYLDISFTSWTAGAQGGGLAYSRAVPAPPAGLILFPALAFARRRR